MWRERATKNKGKKTRTMIALVFSLFLSLALHVRTNRRKQIAKYTKLKVQPKNRPWPGDVTMWSGCHCWTIDCKLSCHTWHVSVLGAIFSTSGSNWVPNNDLVHQASIAKTLIYWASINVCLECVVVGNNRIWLSCCGTIRNGKLLWIVHTYLQCHAPAQENTVQPDNHSRPWLCLKRHAPFAGRLVVSHTYRAVAHLTPTHLTVAVAHLTVVSFTETFIIAQTKLHLWLIAAVSV